MEFVSTRGGAAVTASHAILDGLAPGGGLYAPIALPRVDVQALAGLTYPRRIVQVLREVLSDYDADALYEDAVFSASRFDGYPAPARRLEDGLHVLELFHGPTLAFKDMALTLMPRLLTRAMRMRGEKNKAAVLVATSGDTGKAALEGFLDVPDTTVTVFYPSGGVSALQERQMLTTGGGNTRVVAVRGNFDDAQRGVKNVLNSKDANARMLERGFHLTSANSINLGRLAPQIVYYFSAYADLYARGEIALGAPIHFVVPTGNFGNILALWYAKRMGLPVGKLICASNANDVLTEFIHTGVYNARRPFRKTLSPSMDILVSSNLERLLYALSCPNGISGDVAAASVRDMMCALSRERSFVAPDRVRERVCDEFCAYAVDDQGTRAEIKRVADACGYVLDPHTAVASAALGQYREQSGDAAPAVVVATASPFKFASDVLGAFGGDASALDDRACLNRLSAIAGVPVPQQAMRVFDLPIRHTRVCDASELENEALRPW